MSQTPESDWGSDPAPAGVASAGSALPPAARRRLDQAADKVADAEAGLRVATTRDEEIARAEDEPLSARVASAERVEKARRDVRRAERDLAAVQEEVIFPAGDQGQDPDAAKGPELYFANVGEFVGQWLRFVYRREVSKGGEWRWSARWWQSEEAISRLDALWRAWEHLRLDPALGLSVWWRDHADHHMRVLMGADGPFRFSGLDLPERGMPLPHEDPPAGLFRDERAAAAQDESSD